MQEKSEEVFCTRVSALVAISEAETKVNGELTRCIELKRDLLIWMSRNGSAGCSLVTPIIEKTSSRIRELRNLLRLLSLMRQRCPQF